MSTSANLVQKTKDDLKGSNVPIADGQRLGANRPF